MNRTNITVGLVTIAGVIGVFTPPECSMKARSAIVVLLGATMFAQLLED